MGYSGDVIHFAADKWLTPSVKDIEHIDQDAVSTASSRSFSLEILVSFSIFEVLFYIAATIKKYFLSVCMYICMYVCKFI